jgi:hypothetical protein
MAVARAVSEDGLRWRLVEPVPITRGRRAESPALVRVGGTWHLLWSGGSGVQHATAAALEGPWTPAGVVTGGFAPELLPLDDARALYGWVDGAFRVRLRVLEWEGMEISGVVSPRCPDGPRPEGPLPRYGSNQESAGP